MAVVIVVQTRALYPPKNTTTAPRLDQLGIGLGYAASAAAGEGFGRIGPAFSGQARGYDLAEPVGSSYREFARCDCLHIMQEPFDDEVTTTARREACAAEDGEGEEEEGEGEHEKMEGDEQDRADWGFEAEGQEAEWSIHTASWVTD